MQVRKKLSLLLVLAMLFSLAPSPVSGVMTANAQTPETTIGENADVQQGVAPDGAIVGEDSTTPAETSNTDQPAPTDVLSAPAETIAMDLNATTALRNGLKAEYFTAQADAPFAFITKKSTIVDNQILFGDMEGVLTRQTGNKDNAGVRWTGKIIPKKTGDYVFSTFSDNGVKLYVGDTTNPIINWWVNQWDIEQKAPSMHLIADQVYPFQMDYFERDGGSHVTLYWNDGVSGRVAVPSDVFYLPDDFTPPVITKVDLSNAKLIEKEVSGYVTLNVANLTDTAKFSLVKASGVAVDTTLTIQDRNNSTGVVTIAVPTNLKVGAYKFKVSDGTVTAVGDTNVLVMQKEVRSEYPRPDWQRNTFMSLNGQWDFKFDNDKIGVTNKWYEQEIKSLKINVPFPWESPLSGVMRPEYLGTAWYQRDLVLPAATWADKQVIIKFGAVDWKCSLWVNGEKIGDNEGGYTPFEFNITNKVKRNGENNKITLMVNDEASYGYQGYTALVGKQGKNAPCGYTHTSGIWQSVIVEGQTSTTRMEYAHANPDIDAKKVTFKINVLGGTAGKVLNVSYDFKSRLWNEATQTDDTTGDNLTGNVNVTLTKADAEEVTVEILMPNQKLWSPDQPNLYTGTLTLKDGATVVDTVSTYFGQRKISTKFYDESLGDHNYKYIYLNNKPIFLSGLLDQGFWEEGVYTAPTAEALKFDISSMRARGFNLIRKHLKIEDPIQYYWADRLGMMVWADMPHATNMNTIRDNANAPLQNGSGRPVYEKALREMIKRDYSHPSIISWILFNETWGINYGDPSTVTWVGQMQELTKSLDPTRLAEDMSACNDDHIQPTDLNTFHMYHGSYSATKGRVEGYNNGLYIGSTNNFRGGQKQDGDPWLNSEYGGVAAYDGDHDVSWCFKYQTDIQRLRQKLNGYVYTEPFDVEYECNGLLNYDRTSKIFGYEQIAYGGDMSIKNLNQANYIGIDKEPIVTVAQGSNYTATVGMMNWSGDTIQTPVLKWRLDGTDAYGNKVDTNIKGEKTDIKYLPTTYETATVSFVIPNDPLFSKFAGTVTVWVEDGSGKVIAKNFSNLKVTNGQTTPAVVDLTNNSFALRQTTSTPASPTFTDGVGSITYAYTVPDAFDVNNLNGMKILAELSAIKPTEAQTSEGEEKPSDVTVSINGHDVAAVFIPDAPRDMRGTLSLNSNSASAGSFGYLVNLNVDKATLATLKTELATSKVLTVKYEVKSTAANKNGIQVFGESVGRYAVNPMILLNPTTQVATTTTTNLTATEQTLGASISKNFSVESDVTGNPKFSAGTYAVTVNGNVVTVSENGTTIATANSAAAVKHIKITYFDREVMVYTNNNPEALIDVYGKTVQAIADVKASGTGTVSSFVIAPETYKNESFVVTENEVQYVESFGKNDALPKWEKMADGGSFTQVLNGTNDTSKDGYVTFVATDKGQKIINHNISASNLVLEGDFKITAQEGTANGNVGFIVRGSEYKNNGDGADGYYIGVGINDGGFIEVGRMHNNWTPLKKVTGVGGIELNKVVRLKVVAMGSRIQVYVNDDPKAYVDLYDATYLTGSIAVRGYRCSGTVDNIVVATAPRYSANFEKGTEANTNYKDEAKLDEWTRDGNWEISNGKLVATDAGKAFVGSDAWSDYDMSTDISSSNAVSGFIFRALKAKTNLNGYNVVVDAPGSKLVLSKMVDGTDTIIKSVPVTVSATAKLRVTAINNLIKVYYTSAATPDITVVDNTYFKGRVGLISKSGTTTFDNFQVSDKFRFEDRFYDGALGGWKNLKGTWTTKDNNMSVALGTGDKLVDGYATTGDFQLDFDLRLNEGSENKYNAGVVFRASDFGPGNDDLRGYVLGLNVSKPGVAEPSGLELGDLHYGWRPIKTGDVSLKNGDWYHLTIRCEGNSIKAFVNGAKIIDVLDNQYTHGQIGLRNFNAGASYKNLVLKQLSDVDAGFKASAIETPTGVTGVVENFTSDAKDTTVYVAVYNADGTLRSLASKDVTIVGFGSERVDVAINKAETAGCTYKVFAWDATKNATTHELINPMQPICNTFSGAF